MASVTAYPLEREEDIKKLLSIDDPRDNLYMHVSLYTGLRMNEIITLEWGDLVFKGGIPKSEVSVYLSKQEKTRKLEIHPDLQICIGDIYNGQSLKSYVFISKFNIKGKRKHISKETVNRLIVKKWFEKLGIKAVSHTSHTLRKTFAFNYYQRQYQIDPSLALERTRQALMHATVEMTIKYLGLTETSVKLGYLALDYMATKNPVIQKISSGNLTIEMFVDFCNKKGLPVRDSLMEYLSPMNSDNAVITEAVESIIGNE